MPSLNFGDAPPWLQWLLAVVAVAGFVVGAIKGVPPAWKVVTRFVTTINALGDLPEELQKQRQFRKEMTATLTEQNTKLDDHDTVLEKLRRQVENDHHTNLRDEVTQALSVATDTKTLVEGLHGRVDDVDRRLTKSEVQGNALRSDFEDTHPRTIKEKP